MSEELVIDLAAKIGNIVGMLAKFRTTGGSFSAEEVCYLVDYLGSCEQLARANHRHASWMADELVHMHGQLQETRLPNLPPPPPRGFGMFAVIDGGAAP